MNNEELKKKIVEIVNDGIIHGEDNFGVPTSKTIENIADALIAAGIGDVWEITEKAEKAIVSLIKQNKDVEHRAARAEKALRIFAKNCSCADCPFFRDCDIVPGVEDVEGDFSGCFDMYLAIAEKELAEEGKDD